MKLRILFIVRSAPFFHYVKSIAFSLCGRGARVRVLLDRRWTRDEKSLQPLEDLKARFGELFEYDWAQTRSDRFRTFLFFLREIASYRFYLRMSGAQSPFYEARARSYLPSLLQRLMARIWIRGLIRSRVSGALLGLAERLSPAAVRIVEEMRSWQPDAVVAAPVNERFSSADLEYLKAGRALKIPTLLPVISWDNLTTKGYIHVVPDLLLAWNEIQAEEAIRNHRIAPERIRLIGAPLFDRWFSGIAPTPDLDFRASRGIPGDTRFIAYLGSSHDLVGDESWLVNELRRALDQDPACIEIPLVVRPHPANTKIFEGFSMDGVYIVPRATTLPSIDSALQLSYDTMYHASALVGINTSAMIEALIVGKPVIAFLAPRYLGTQSETQHFRQLLAADAVERAENPLEFVEIVKRILAGGDMQREKRRRFVERFIRPLGWTRSAGDAAADVIEAACRGSAETLVSARKFYYWRTTAKG